jgi:dTDP-L-rhamnose 4-epimerase
MKVLITGGAGFIGSRLAKRLLNEGCKVTLLDNLSPQIHGTHPDLSHLPEVPLIRCDVRNKSECWDALDGHDTVVHLAAETGTGQSMYEVERYEAVNLQGTAILMDYLVNRPHAITKVVVASSRAVYGEGRYSCHQHGLVYPAPRRAEDLEKGQFEPRCPVCTQPVTMAPTDEAAPFQPSSFYGLTKQVQEQMVLMFGQSLGISAFALRYQNVYGPGQSLKNPYTGILAIFSNLARAGQAINIFEDGLESRDFVYIDDVVDATWRCISPFASGVNVFNVGSGEACSVLDVANAIVEHFHSPSAVAVTGAFRLGDIRHNLADLTKIRETLGFEPKWKFRDGLKQFLCWAATQQAENASYEKSLAEMRQKGLMRG